jgi:exonuclease SbcC
MVPLKLSLKNFLSYGDSTPPLDFRVFDIACLSGKNGHGKSAIIDAITWALWGKCRVKSNEEVIKRGEREAYVELEFEVEKNHYRVIRSLNRKGNGVSSSLFLQVFDANTNSFKPLAQGKEEAQSKIKKLLKMDYESFICSSFILQGKADEFTKKPPADRKKILASILDLEKYERLSKRAKELATKLKQEEEVLRKKLAEIDSEISQREALERELEDIKAREDKIAFELEKAEKFFEETIRKSELLKTHVDRYRELQEEREKTKNLCDTLEKELTKLLLEIEKDREVLSSREEILQGYGEFERVREEESLLSEKLLKYTALIKELESLKAIINEEKTGIENRISSLTGKKEELEARLSQIEKLIDREKEIEEGFACFVGLCSQNDLLEKKKQAVEKLKILELDIKNNIEREKLLIETRILELETRAKDLKQRSKELEKLNEECLELRAEIKDVERKISELELLKERLKAIEDEKKSITWNKIELEKKKREELQKLEIITLDTKKTRCPLCESPLEEEAKSALVEKIQRTIATLEDLIEKDKERIKALEDKEKELFLQISQLESSIKNVSELNKLLGEKEKALENARSALKELETINEELDNLKKILFEENYAVELREQLRNVHNEIKNLDYDEVRHREVKENLERLKKFEMDKLILEQEKRNKSSLEKEILSIEQELFSLSKILDSESYALKHREKALKIQEEINELGYNEAKHRELKKHLEELEKFSKEKEKLDRAIQSLSLRERERENLNNRLETERERLKRIEKEINEISEKVKEGQFIEEKKKIAEKNLLDIKKARETLIEEKTKIVSTLERIEELDKKKTQIQEDIKRLSYESKVYQELERAFSKNGIQALIIENAVPEIEMEANRILKKLTDGNMTLSLEMVKPTQRGNEKETLDIKIADASGIRSYETFSGGEAFRIDFALRVAISKFIANRSGAQLRTLVIDEGFGTQDKDGLTQFVDVINAIKGDFEKIIVITHVDELKDKFPVRIEVTKEPGKGSSFEII